MALTQIDRTLLTRCLAKEPGAWKDFVDRFMGLFVHVVTHTAHSRSVRVSQEDIDDLCAEVFVTLLANDFAVLRQFVGKSSLATYLTVVARRVVVREMSQRRMAQALGHTPPSPETADRSESGESGRVVDQEEVERMLDGLDPREADIIRQFHLEGRSYREISSGLGVPQNTIGPTLSRARAKLRRKVEQ